MWKAMMPMRIQKKDPNSGIFNCFSKPVFFLYLLRVELVAFLRSAAPSTPHP